LILSVFPLFSVQTSLIFTVFTVRTALFAVQTSLVFPVFAVLLLLFAVKASLVGLFHAVPAGQAALIFAFSLLMPALRFELLLAHQRIAPAFQLLLFALRFRAQLRVGAETVLAAVSANFGGVFCLLFSLQVPDGGPASGQRDGDKRRAKGEQQSGFHRSFSG